MSSLENFWHLSLPGHKSFVFLWSRFSSSRAQDEPEIEIIVFEDRDIFEGHVSWVALQEYARNAEENVERFLEMTMCSLSGPDAAYCNSSSQNSSYVCSFAHKANNRTVTWQTTSDGIAFTLGSVELTPLSSSESVKIQNALFKCLTEQIAGLRSQNTKLQFEHKELDARGSQTLQDAVAAKVELEENMYSQFALLLNSKKRKIYALQEQVKHLQSAKPGSAERLNSPSVEQSSSDKDVVGSKSRKRPGSRSVPTSKMVAAAASSEKKDDESDSGSEQLLDYSPQHSPLERNQSPNMLDSDDDN